MCWDPGVPEPLLVDVFCGPGHTAGNRLAVILDDPSGPVQRQRRAAELGYSETVFVDDGSAADIYTPSVRLPFAGHPLVGASWLLRHRLGSCEVLHPAAGAVPAWAEGGFGWVSGRPEWVTGRTTRQLASPAEVEALPGPPDGTGFLYVWAWTDEPAGSVRARAFPRRGDAIVEDEATGAAALRLTAELGRSLTVRQGAGSEIRTRLLPEGRIGVGGRVRQVRPDPQDARRTS
ncbi:PhzF family phenazine biosynthesis protein [Pseudonocardia kongjuensis]|uniref:PhzF family phenazine biosynthesis protein n=1 Tax=Pseudonocardia kongjuensis TaxID=102227 RepID=A0ABN1XXX8_9PSEU